MMLSYILRCKWNSHKVVLRSIDGNADEDLEVYDNDDENTNAEYNHLSQEEECNEEEKKKGGEESPPS